MRLRVFLFILIMYISIQIIPVSKSNPDEVLKSNTWDNTIHIDNDTELAMFSSSGSGTENDPYIIENLRMNPSSYIHYYVKGGIIIRHTTKHFIVRNCEIEGQLTYGGIRIDEVADNTAQVYNNIVTNCYSGITMYNCSYNTVIENNVFNCEYGISLVFAEYITITQNNCSFNNLFGITLIHNPSRAATITLNTLLKNSKYGVFLNDRSSDCLIYKNDFDENNKGSTNALDDGINNTWYDEVTKKGNYWAQHKSTDPYHIDGSANSKDMYPLQRSINAPHNGLISGWYLSFVLMALMLISLSKRRK